MLVSAKALLLVAAIVGSVNAQSTEVVTLPETTVTGATVTLPATSYTIVIPAPAPAGPGPAPGPAPGPGHPLLPLPQEVPKELVQALLPVLARVPVLGQLQDHLQSFLELGIFIT